MALPWTDILQEHITKIKKIHIQEIRNYLDSHDGSGGTAHALASHVSPGFMSTAHYDICESAIAGGVGVQSVTGSAPIASTGGQTPQISISNAVGGGSPAAGAMSGADKVKLDTYPADYASISAAINVKGIIGSVTTDNDAVVITNPVASEAHINIANATQTVPGFMSADDKKKLDTMDGFPIGSVIMWHDLGSSDNANGLYRYDDLFDASGIGKVGKPYEKWRVMNGYAGGQNAPMHLDESGASVGINMANRFPTGALYAGYSGDKWQESGGVKYRNAANTIVYGTNEQFITSSQLPSHAHCYRGDDMIGRYCRGGVNFAPDLSSIEIAGRAEFANIAYDASSNGGGSVPPYKTVEFQERGVAINNMPAFCRFYFLFKYKA